MSERTCQGEKTLHGKALKRERVGVLKSNEVTGMAGAEWWRGRDVEDKSEEVA